MNPRWTGLLLACLVCLAVPCGAATIALSGPAGARVFLDGERVGTLPLDSPIEVNVGQYDLRLQLAGYEDHHEQVRVRSKDAAMVMKLSMLPLQRWRAATYSALLAGLGQHYERRSRRGWTMMGLQLAAGVVAGIGEAQFQSHRDDYEVLNRKYEVAVSPSVIASLRDQRQTAYDDMGTAQTLRNLALAGVAAVGIWSVLDAWMGFDDLYVAASAPVSSPVDSPESAGSGGVRLGWRLKF